MGAGGECKEVAVAGAETARGGVAVSGLGGGPGRDEGQSHPDASSAALPEAG